MLADTQHAGLTPPMQGGMPQQQFQGAPSGQPGLSAGGGQSNPQFDMMQLDDAVQSDPKAAKEVADALQRALATGAITEQQINLIFKLAQACLNNPSLWPNVKAFAVKNGLCGPHDLPEQYDHNFVKVLVMAAKSVASVHAQPTQGGTPVQGGQPGPGGMPVEAAAQAGEGGTYTIPADVVRAKGKDFFDTMVRKYHTPNGYKE